MVNSTASLPLLLKQLGLPVIYQHYEEKAQQALEAGWTHLDYLNVLSDLEVSSRRQKRIQRHIKEAKLPLGKTLDQFDFKATRSINVAQIQALADNNSWVRQANNLIIFGPSGVGKTHLAASIAYRMIEQGSRALFSSTTAIVQRLQKARAEFKLAEQLAKLARVPLLILDDLSYVKKSEMETSVLFELIAERYETSSLIITSVVKAAQFILAQELFAIQEKHYPELNTARCWLQDSLEHYLQPRVEPSLHGFSRIEYLEYSLKNLLEAVKCLLPCLKEEAKQQLQQLLSNERKGQPEKQYA